MFCVSSYFFKVKYERWSKSTQSYRQVSNPLSYFISEYRRHHCPKGVDIRLLSPLTKLDTLFSQPVGGNGSLENCSSLPLYCSVWDVSVETQWVGAYGRLCFTDVLLHKGGRAPRGTVSRTHWKLYKTVIWPLASRETLLVLGCCSQTDSFFPKSFLWNSHDRRLVIIGCHEGSKQI